MSRDIFVQALPLGIASVEDIPDEFIPRPLPVTRAEVIAVLTVEAPHANISDPAWVTIAVPDRYHIEVNLGTSERLEHVGMRQARWTAGFRDVTHRKAIPCE